MEERNRSKLETLLNLALIVLAIAFFATLVARYTKPDTAGSRKPPLEIGSTIDVPDLKWGQADKTLLLVLSTKCNFCTESSPFYRRIVQEVEGNPGIRLIAFLPQDASEGREYLSANGVRISDVRQLGPGTLGVAGVPSLILTDRNGKVVDLWFGKLGANVESLVMSRLKGEAESGEGSIDAAALREAFRKKEPLVVLSIDDRETYKHARIEGSINIPFDELETRIANELKPTDKIVIYERDGEKYSNAAFEILKKNGFNHVAVLRGGFRKWEESAKREQ